MVSRYRHTVAQQIIFRGAHELNVRFGPILLQNYLAGVET